MNRRFLLSLGLALAALPAHAGTFAPAPIAPDLGLERFTRGTTRQMAGRDVFANPWATVTVSHVDVYDRFPYVEARDFQFVSDPAWNRVVFGEAGEGIAAFDGRGTDAGPLASPHGMTVDERDRLYVADTGHDRIVVLQVSTEYAQATLKPLFTIEGLRGPYDVAYSDGGTPFVSGDDQLLVADTGRNRVALYSLGETGATLASSLGTLGSGDGAFAGPMAVAFGRADGANTREAYVADAHSARLVHLSIERGALRWAGSVPAGASVVTSLDTDRWGNVYAAAPQQGLVRKFNAALEPVAELRGAIARPRAFRVPFATVRDHRDGTTRREGKPNALSLDQWTDQSGVVLWNLGLSVDQLGVVGGEQPAAHFTLTDPARVTLEVRDAADGRVLATRDAGLFAAGAHDVALAAADLPAGDAAHDLTLRVVAASRYAQGPTASAQANFRANGGGIAAPVTAALIGNWPNPVREGTTIAFALPAASASHATLAVYDAQGRRVRAWTGPFVAGLNSLAWDGRDGEGHPVRSGLYFLRLDADDARSNRRLVVVR